MGGCETAVDDPLGACARADRGDNTGMRLSSTLGWSLGLAGLLALVGLAAVCVRQHQALSTLRVQALEQEALQTELDRLREENQAMSAQRNRETDLAQAQENTRDLMRLRNEITQLRAQLAEMEVLRAANARLLQAIGRTPALESNQMALITSARKMGAILGISVRAPASGQEGVEILGILPDSPVVGSGLTVGDVIYALDGQRVRSPGDLQAHMLTRKPGESVLVDVLRTNTVLRFQVQTRAWPE